MMHRHLANPDAVVTLVDELLPTLDYPEIIYLQGDLGAGKTTFARYLLQALGFTGLVKSPTYTLYESYHLAELTVCHFDLYRMVDPTELDDIGFRDLIDVDLVLIEWPERAVDHLPPATLSVALAYAGDGRDVSITRHN